MCKIRSISFVLVTVVACLWTGAVHSGPATPTWFDPDGVSVGDDWHYRVPVSIATASVGQYRRIAVNFDTLLSNLGVTGTFDSNSYRVVRGNGTELASYEFFDALYNGVADALANNQGDLIIELEDAGPTTYYLYFDITANAAGTKTSPGATSIGWYDLDWAKRMPIQIDNTGNASVLTEYQIYFELDNSYTDFWANVDADGDDIRLIASDGSTELNFWIQRLDTTNEAANIWVQVDSIPASSSSSIYLYYDNASAANVSDEEATFSYSGLTDLMVVVSENMDGDNIEIISLADGNTIDDGTTTLNLDRGDIGTLPGVSVDTVIQGTKPFYGRGDGDGEEAIVPIAFASTSFVGPTERSGTQSWSVFAPFVTATVTIEDGGTDGSPSVTVVNSGAQSFISKDVSSTANTAVISSTVPVLVTHNVSTTDPFVLYPASTELYGVHSGSLFIGYMADGTTGTAAPSTGSFAALSGNKGTRQTISSGGTQGTGAAYRLSASQPIGAIQQADSDGSETSSFIAYKEFGTEYFLPTTAQYIAIACVETVSLTLYNAAGASVETTTCTPSGSAPGKAIFNDSGSTAVNYVAGHYVVGDAPFYAYYEQSDQDETNLWSFPSSRKFAYPHPSHTVGSAESIASTTLGTEEGFGIDVTDSSGSYVCNDVVTVTVDADVGMFLADAAVDTIEARILDNAMALFTTLILYDDGATGSDVTANDGQYTNTFTLPGTGGTSGNWTIQARAGDAPNYDNGYIALDSDTITLTCGVQPDAMIKNSSEGSFTGNDIYEATVTTQVKSQSVDNAQTATYVLQFQNDGQLTDSIVVTGTASGSSGGGSFTVAYFDGSTDITADVTGAGYTFANVAIGGSDTLSVEVVPGLSVADGTTFDVDITATSVTDGTAVDQLRASTGVNALDDDGDGITNGQEQLLGMDPNSVDSDGDNIRDDHEMTNFASPEDTDNDGTIDALDQDSDGDGILDIDEAGDASLATTPVDTDGDGTPDYQDLDSDADGTPDLFEGSNDTDRDGVPDYLDTNDEVVNTEQFVSGAQLQGGGCQSRASSWLWFGFIGLFWLGRRYVFAK